MFVRRWRRAAPTAPAAAPDTWRPTGTALVTGGTGGIGRHVARWLARHGARASSWSAAADPTPREPSELAEEIRASGSEVTVAACDITDRAALRALLAGPARRPAALTSVFPHRGHPGRRHPRHP
ncbi:SDR family NAD(P)-dependent oxidoreductase [Streptomyces sp. KL116D]|uniref:SDR family NAD(P)-dependent oxidoreductase n=1 Tax=Streptomyces sp. KL116D TaxID=3045152 RepID=UPI003557B50D